MTDPITDDSAQLRLIRDSLFGRTPDPDDEGDTDDDVPHLIVRREGDNPLVVDSGREAALAWVAQIFDHPTQ